MLLDILCALGLLLWIVRRQRHEREAAERLRRICDEIERTRPMPDSAWVRLGRREERHHA